MKKLTAGFLAVCMAAGLMTGCGAPEPEDEGTTVKTEAAKAVSGDTLKAEEEGTADTSGSVDGGTVSPQDYKVGLMIPGNLLIHHLADTTKVSASLPLVPALGLIALSVVLTLIGGLIPSKKAAKSDPVTALRTE